MSDDNFLLLLLVRTQFPFPGWHFVRWLENFANNDDKIEIHNAKKLPYKLGHNHFSHLSLDEWRQQVRLGLGKANRTSYSVRGVHPTPSPEDFAKLPKSVDWVKAGAVTPPKDQGECGSCWSFSTTGALEGAYKIKYNKLLSFSEQNLVDCDNDRHGGSDQGCNGGLMDNAFSFVEENGGLCTEADYPYTSGETEHAGIFCNQKKCKKVPEVAPKNFTDVEPNSEPALMSAVAQQPVSIAIEADQEDFQLYSSGVYTAKCGDNLDHGVLVVGYGFWEDGTPFWKVKNSWSEKWGMGGYILLERSINQDGGQCGILEAASYPVL
jgi:KDEL-tailed cysteine endopeptidase